MYWNLCFVVWHGKRPQLGVNSPVSLYSCISFLSSHMIVRYYSLSLFIPHFCFRYGDYLSYRSLYARALNTQTDKISVVYMSSNHTGKNEYAATSKK